VTTTVFWATDLDFRVSRLFFVPDHAENAWHHGEFLLWRLLYESDDYLTAVLCSISIACIVVGALRRKHRRLLLYGVFILLSVAIGAGLIVNMLLKEHWGHPRPSDLVEFGGNGTYMPPWAKGSAENGESFPSGHAAIGFSFFVFWFIWRGRRPRLAEKCFVGALALGALLGLGRIIQGRHFLSDVLWAAYIPYFVCLMLYYFAFRFPSREHRLCARAKAPILNGENLPV
jgi:membrane-associated PAP2 superfamily phosphatase